MWQSQFGGFLMAIDTDNADVQVYCHEFSHIITTGWPEVTVWEQ